MNRVLSGARSRSRRMTRRLRRAARPFGRRLGAAARQVPAPVRQAASRTALRRPWSVEVPTDHLLQGAQAGLSAEEFSARTGDLLWASTRVADGPHVQLLRLADDSPGPLTDAQLLATPYAALARRCIDVRGHWFGATDDAGVLALARSAIARHRDTSDRDRPAPPAASGSADPVLVAPVAGSEYFQVLDGHHRVAELAASGAATARVVAKWLPVRTPVQRLLEEMSWLEGSRELYQPLPMPELQQSWTLVRHCEDRLRKMTDWLTAEDLMPPRATTYLDVASCYGWFVGRMAALGFEATGIERDPLAPRLGAAAYGLDPAAITTGNVENVLPWTEQRDVVSCFSLLHHLALGRGGVSAERLLELLDRVTRRVLFFDTGQAHEAWFRESLPQWDTAYVERFLRAHTTFDRIIDLGPDGDARGPYRDNYGRTLFACVRSYS
jgi:hypothetical protein